MTAWREPDGCYVVANLINEQSGIVATGVALADLPVERQECRSFEGEAQMTPVLKRGAQVLWTQYLDIPRAIHTRPLAADT